MSPDEERWAEALQVLKMHGDRAEAFILKRRLALKDDPAGRERWRLIADRLAEVREAAARRLS